jgi:hypothetical protein
VAIASELIAKKIISSANAPGLNIDDNQMFARQRVPAQVKVNMRVGLPLKVALTSWHRHSSLSFTGSSLDSDPTVFVRSTTHLLRFLWVNDPLAALLPYGD